jgi:predicted PurR-regulated permease PerM
MRSSFSVLGPPSSGPPPQPYLRPFTCTPTTAAMAESRRIIDIAPAALVKVIATVVVVWLWLQLWQLLMVILVAIVLAITLYPIVEWLERRGLPCAVGATGVVVVLALLIVGFFWITGASLTGQARMLTGRVTEVEQMVIERAPPWMTEAIRRNATGMPDASAVAGYAVNAGRLVLGAIVVAALVLILTIYLLIEGKQTYAWFLAYAPPPHRARVDVTGREARRAILGYAVGNVATSIFATVFVLISLSLLHVPAALLLALLAGIFDFVPVLGFICSAFPAVLLALSVSPAVAITVAALYIGYHALENYWIGPFVYGGRLRLSNLAVILAFAVGAEVGGIVGALLALPIAAMYPVIESVWLKEYLGRDAVETHRRIERRGA